MFESCLFTIESIPVSSKHGPSTSSRTPTRSVACLSCKDTEMPSLWFLCVCCCCECEVYKIQIELLQVLCLYCGLYVGVVLVVLVQFISSATTDGLSVGSLALPLDVDTMSGCVVLNIAASDDEPALLCYVCAHCDTCLGQRVTEDSNLINGIAANQQCTNCFITSFVCTFACTGVIIPESRQLYVKTCCPIIVAFAPYYGA